MTMIRSASNTAVNKPQYISIGESVQTPPCLVADVFESRDQSWRVAITTPTNTPPIPLSELTVSLPDLEPGYTLLRAILINVQRLARNNYVATFTEVNINASGESFYEAISNLKALIVDMFDLLSSVGRHKLGPEPRKQLRALAAIIRKIEDNA